MMKHLLTLLLIISSLSLGQEVMASHYYLTDVDLFEREQLILLRDNKIQTTEHLLQASVTNEQRKRLAAYLKISEVQVFEFAQSCELMQIQGLGPRAVNLLKAAGVKRADDLSRMEPDALLEKLLNVNKAEQFTNKQPTLDLVRYWIEQSKTVPLRIQI